MNIGMLFGIAMGALAIATSANAQVFVTCEQTSGASAWANSTYKISPGSIQTWNGNSGWSVNHCAGNACSTDDNAYTLAWQTRNNGQTAYTISDNTLTIQRRTGFVIHDYVSHQYGYDGRLNPYNSVTGGITSGRAGVGQCRAGSDPGLAAPLF
jgi:hypothetical protein